MWRNVVQFGVLIKIRTNVDQRPMTSGYQLFNKGRCTWLYLTNLFRTWLTDEDLLTRTTNSKPIGATSGISSLSILTLVGQIARAIHGVSSARVVRKPMHEICSPVKQSCFLSELRPSLLPVGRARLSLDSPHKDKGDSDCRNNRKTYRTIWKIGTERKERKPFMSLPS